MVRAFLEGWIETIAFMKANKEKTVEITAKVINVQRRRWPRAPMTSRSAPSAPTARSIRRRSRRSRQSFIEMGLLKEPPADEVMFTTQFVPVKVGQK